MAIKTGQKIEGDVVPKHKSKKPATAPKPEATADPGLAKLEAHFKSKAYSDRMKKMAAAYGKDRVFGGPVPMRQIHVWPSGFVEVDTEVLAPRGGFPRGRICEISGPESSGKTTFLLQCIAHFQRQGLRCRFVDLEDAMDDAYAEANGVRTDLWTFSVPKSGEQAIAMVMEGLTGKILTGKNKWTKIGDPDDIVILDSTGAMRKKVDAERPLEGDGSNRSMAGRANLQEQLIERVKPALFEVQNLLFLVSQVRVNINSGLYGKKTRTTTSKALDHEFTIRMEVTRGNKVKKGDKVIGHMVKFKTSKNKVGAEGGFCEIYMAYGEGLSKEFMLVDAGIRTRVLEKDGNWVSYRGERLGNGREQTRVMLKEHPDLFAQIEAEVQEHLKTKTKKDLTPVADMFEDLELGGAPVLVDED